MRQHGNIYSFIYIYYTSQVRHFEVLYGVIRHMAEDYISFRVVKSGEKIEVVRYQMPIKCGVERGFTQKKKSIDELDGTEEKREDNLARIRTTIRRIVWSNIGQYSKFLTLTYKQTILDPNLVRKHLATFFKGMKRAGYDLDYLYVLEHQKERGEKEGNEGCLHVHIIIFHDKYIPWQTIKRYWKHGSIDIHALRHIEDVGAYVCKYITKDNLKDFGARAFATSQGIKRSYDSCFYTSGWSDHFEDDWSFERIMQCLNITWHDTKTFDMELHNGGEPFYVKQKVDFWQGKLVNGSLVEKSFRLPELLDRMKKCGLLNQDLLKR